MHCSDIQVLFFDRVQSSFTKCRVIHICRKKGTELVDSFLSKIGII